MKVLRATRHSRRFRDVRADMSPLIPQERKFLPIKTRVGCAGESVEFRPRLVQAIDPIELANLFT